MYLVLGTFNVIGVSVNPSPPTGLVCLFNPGSLARGCLVYLTDTATGVTYCRVVARSLNTPVNVSLCPASSFSDLSAGMYSVEVYDITSDGSVSPLPAIIGHVVILITWKGTKLLLILLFHYIKLRCNVLICSQYGV